MNTHRATPAELAEARLFWENFSSRNSASGTVRDAIAKERAEAQAILANFENKPKYNIVGHLIIGFGCSVSFFVGWIMARVFMGGR